MKQTNLLLITFDQLRADWCDVNSKSTNMPHVAKIAEEGWHATYCYTSSPQCMPARFSWLTGLEPSRIGVTSNGRYELSNQSPSFVRDLRNSGWKTTLIGKAHFYSHLSSMDMRNKLNKLNELGFSEVIEVAGPRALRNVGCTLTDEWRAKNVYEKQKQDLDLRYRSHIEENAWKVKTTLLPNELYPDIWIAKKAEDMIRNKKDTEPWFLWVSFVGPHEPFDTPKPWKGIHKFGDIKESKNNYDWIDRLDDQCLLKQKYNNWKGKIQDNDILKLKCDYGDHIKLLDDQVGNLMREINQRSDKNSWNIAITSDHGEILGDGGMLYKGSFQEGAIRVPWVYRGIRPCKSEPMQKTLGLTKIMKLMVRNLIKNGSSKRLRKKAERSDRAVVEFRDEILFIRGNKKLARKRSGKILWAVELERDGSEKENCYEKKQEELFRKEEWLEIKEWSDKEVTKRRRRNWFIDGIAESLN